MDNQIVLIIGEVFVDTHLDKCDPTPLVRLGGIFHAARAFSALGIDYALAYYAPEYLDASINQWSFNLKTKYCEKIGNIIGAPNVMLINESSEAGDQGYVNLLRGQYESITAHSIKEVLERVRPTDVLLFPGGYDVVSVIKALEEYPARLHIDIQYDSYGVLDNSTCEIDTLFLSTSSNIFLNECRGEFKGFIEYYKKYSVKRLVLKENRGGSTAYLPETGEYAGADSYSVPTMHSVGVGDVYDATLISNAIDECDTQKKMRFASFCAAKYAETLDYNVFKRNVKVSADHYESMAELRGIRLPWDKRKSISIYLAAPDFPDVCTDYLDQLYDSLCYHNFSPRRPIKENGLVTEGMTRAQELELYLKDRALMDECDLLIAVLLNNDPGTLVELGMFKQEGKPTVIFDPYHFCTNMFVRFTPDYLCRSLAETIEATYLCLGGR